MAIISGLRQASITRMSNTLAAVGQQWHNHVLRLQQLMSESRSYSMYRQQTESRLEMVQDNQYEEDIPSNDAGAAGGEGETHFRECQMVSQPQTKLVLTHIAAVCSFFLIVSRLGAWVYRHCSNRGLSL